MRSRIFHVLTKKESRLDMKSNLIIVPSQADPDMPSNEKTQNTELFLL
jgi:hypothetical protein